MGCSYEGIKCLKASDEIGHILHTLLIKTLEQMRGNLRRGGNRMKYNDFAKKPVKKDRRTDRQRIIKHTHTHTRTPNIQNDISRRLESYTLHTAKPITKELFTCGLATDTDSFSNAAMPLERKERHRAALGQTINY